MKVLLAFVALLGLTGCSPEPCTVQSSPIEGLYQAKSDDGYWDYLRFYRDGTVLDFATSGTPEEVEVSAGFQKENSSLPCGCYKVEQSFLSFSTTSDAGGTRDYEGKIVGSTLELDAYSHNLGRRFHQVFHAVPHGQGIKTNAAAETSTRVVASDTKNVTLGPFTVKVPTEWAGFHPGDAATLREQYLEQSKQIYQKLSGGEDPAQSVAIAAFHIAGDDGAFIVVAFTIPPQSDLIDLLKSQAKEKADWGVQHGYIRKYLGLVPVNDDHFSGFYIKTIGKSGNVEVSGGLEHKKLKNTVIQLTLLCPQAWDQSKATNTLAALLRSLTLAAN